MKEAMTVEQIFDELLERYPVLTACKEEIWAAYKAMQDAYRQGGKLLVAGNGGSAADSEHIVGELMKSFRIRRPIDSACASSLAEQFGADGENLAQSMEGALSAISLPSISGLSTAYSNDRDPQVVFAQMVYGYGRKGDVFLGITTSGNSQNVLNALMVAKAKGMRTVALTGKGGGKCPAFSEIVIQVPCEETFAIQELHLPIYHALCAMLESFFFKEEAERH